MRISGFQAAKIATLVGISAFPALAQAQQSGSAAGAQPATVQAAPPAEVQDIVVTALRSRQNLQRTAAAVTVVDGEALKANQIYDLRGIQNLTPAARFSAANTSTRIFIRGVGSQLDFYWIPETTAVNFNGAYVPRFAITGALFDIDSVQVLAGPQGVLYGRSAGGGVVTVASKRPAFENGASGLLQYGNFDQLHLEATGNAVLSSKLAVRVAGTLTKRDGFQNFGLQSDNSRAVRLSARYKATEDFDLLLWGQHFRQTGKPQASPYYFKNAADPYFIDQRDPVTGVDNSTGSFQDYRITMAGYQAQADLDFASLTYVGSWTRQTERSLRKLTGNNQTIDNAQTQYVQSLQLSGRSGKLDWVVGANAIWADSRFDNRFSATIVTGNIFPDIKTRNYSGFGQLTWSIMPSLRLVGGARYSSDSLDMTGTAIVASSCPVSRPFAACTQLPITFDKTWTHWDLKAGAEWDLTPTAMAYANVQTGYAPGTINTVANTVTFNKEVKPQTLLAYTAGIKSSFLDRKLVLNLEGFHYRYDDLIIQQFNPGLGQQTLFNVPHSKIWGGQATLTARPTLNDTFTANLAYTKGEYGSFRVTPTSTDIGGLQISYSPSWTGVLSYQRRFRFADGAHLDARASAFVSSGFWFTFEHAPGTRQSAYTKTDLSIEYFAPSDRWHIGAWVKNVENEAVRSSGSATGRPAPYIASGFVEPPRTYGMTVGFNF